jgi:small GTP-binding protein
MPKVKTVFAGQAGVGKTCIIDCASHGFCKPNTFSTVGATNATVAVKARVDGKETMVEFNIWDTAGQEKYRSLTPMYFTGAHLAFLVYDITSRASFQTLDEFYDLLQQRAPDDCMYILVGNKIDLEDGRQVSHQEADEYRMRIGADYHFETSAIKGTNIKEMFQTIAAAQGLVFEPEQIDYLMTVGYDAGGGGGGRSRGKGCNC